MKTSSACTLTMSSVINLIVLVRIVQLVELVSNPPFVFVYTIKYVQFIIVLRLRLL